MKKINTTLLLGALLGFCACHFEVSTNVVPAKHGNTPFYPGDWTSTPMTGSLTYDDHSHTQLLLYFEGVLDNVPMMNAKIK